MANVGGRRTNGERAFSHKPVVTEIVPSSAWTDDDKNHYLLVDVPDFEKNELKLQVNVSENTITVSGERLVSDKTKIIRFEQTFDLPSNSDAEETSGNFEGGILYVRVPKKAGEEEEETIRGNDTHHDDNNKDENATRVDDEHGQLLGCDSCESFGDKKDKNSKVDSFSGELVEKWGREASRMGMDWAINILKRNKGIVVTAIVAFSFGVIISRNFGSSASGPDQQCPI